MACSHYGNGNGTGTENKTSTTGYKESYPIPGLVQCEQFCKKFIVPGPVPGPAPGPVQCSVNLPIVPFPVFVPVRFPCSVNKPLVRELIRLEVYTVHYLNTSTTTPADGSSRTACSSHPIIQLHRLRVKSVSRETAGFTRRISMPGWITNSKAQ